MTISKSSSFNPSTYALHEDKKSSSPETQLEKWTRLLEERHYSNMHKLLYEVQITEQCLTKLCIAHSYEPKLHYMFQSVLGRVRILREFCEGKVEDQVIVGEIYNGL